VLSEEDGTGQPNVTFIVGSIWTFYFDYLNILSWLFEK
jgi:hypothetical protein